MGRPGLVEHAQLGAHVGELAWVGNALGLDLEDRDLVDQFAEGDGDRKFGHGASLAVTPAIEQRRVRDGRGRADRHAVVVSNPVCPYHSRPHLERWQSGRMRRIRNPVYGFAVTWVRIPPSPPLGSATS